MFHEHREVIAQLKESNGYFVTVFEKHNSLDEEIAQMEKNLANQFEIEKKKKEKLRLKDEVYNIIIKHKSEVAV
ncbi:hypothetical protein CRV08_03945 [Halarcobacter ebronensis]|uniref:DUF465 domain-containing protein n=1 Tax=Halarcobacter ebronensis TaxID=1462615 RepID=A0A4Q0YF64_9BACT|nr:DUF465 domain-containing protein [Halarcobacter ebronensis]QKF82543.1 DUF465 domain-containing protein [Halarcobacter ebronensis]RXJ69170.1 hypothetical protein CRV08_03945 [Halarcobacter ebronensis]RXK07441.1 hypothetical protein CRV07_02975 [Halarcobacter ebronensis]